MICIIRGEPSAVPKRWLGLIVATGESCQLPLAGRTLVEHVIERALPQVSALLVCGTGDRSSPGGHGLPVVAPEHAGLLAAILAGLEWTAAHSRETPWLATFAADVPVFPIDLVERLGCAVGAEGADMAWAISGDRSVPTFGLWPVRLRRALRRALYRRPGLGLEEWSENFRSARAEFSPDTEPLIPVRGPEDLTSLLAYIDSGAAAGTIR